MLLDSHIILWWFSTPSRIRREAFAVMTSDEAELYVSAASWWELAIKRALGRVRFDPRALMSKLDSASVKKLDVSFVHAEESAALPPHHSDPFDRLLVAQAFVEGLTLITRDRAFSRYGIAVLPA